MDPVRPSTSSPAPPRGLLLANLLLPGVSTASWCILGPRKYFGVLILLLTALEGGQTHTLTGKAYIPTRTLSPEGSKLTFLKPSACFPVYKLNSSSLLMSYFDNMCIHIDKKLTIGLAVALPGAALVCGGVLVGGVVYKVLRPKKPASSATTGPGPLTNTHTASRRNSVELVNRTPIQAQVAAAALV